MSSDVLKNKAELFVPIDKGTLHAEQLMHRPSITYWQDARMRLRKNPVAIFSGGLILFVGLAAIFGPMFLKYDYETQEVWNKHAPPNLGMEAIVEVPIEYVPKLAVEPQPAGPGIPVPGSTPSAVESAPSMITSAPQTPAGFKLSSPATTRGIIIEWDQTPTAKHYSIYRSTQEGNLGIPLGEFPGSRLNYLDRANLEIGKKYFYAIAASNSMGESEPSQQIVVEPKLVVGLLDARKFKSDASPGDTITTFPHYLGTDYLGRDLLARILYGTRISLFIGIVAPILFVFIGIVYGCISGYFGGMVDNVMMRIADIIVTIPNLLILIMLQVVLGSGPVTLIAALVIADWASVSQQIRGNVLRIREMEFIHAAELLGTSFWGMIFKHLLPNVMGTVLVLFSLAIPRVIFTEAFLSFIGLGIAPPLPSLGSVTREGAEVMTTYPMALVAPALLLSLTVLSFNLFGDGMRDALDPKQRGTR